MHWGIVICRWLPFSRIKYSWKIKISLIFLMYMRLWAQCPLCSHNRQTLFSKHMVLHTRMAQITIPRCHPRPGWSDPSTAGLPHGSQWHCWDNFAMALPLFPWLFSLWQKALSCVLFTNSPKPALNPDCQGYRESFKPLTGTGRSLRYLGLCVCFSYEPRCSIITFLLFLVYSMSLFDRDSRRFLRGL